MAAPGEQQGKISHIPALDGLRGAAVAGVLAYHLGRLPGGYLGVDLFFVLSGFLITSLLLAEQAASGSVDLGDFWSRRARRLLPALWLLLLGVAAYAAVVARPVDLPGLRTDAFATMAYLANWHTIVGGASYWDISLAPSPLQHTWSLAIEEQFYLVWPLVFVGLLARARRHRADVATIVLRVAVVGAAASAAGLVLLHSGGASDTRVYEGTDTRAAALLLGVALAAWRARPHRRDRSGLVEGAGVAALAVLAACWWGLDGRSPWVYRGGLAAASVLGTVVVAAASRPRSTVVGRVFRIAPLRWLGAISYGLYLWHWPVYQALDARNGRFPGLGRRHLEPGELLAAKVLLSLAVAVASYRLLEQPIRRGALRGRLAPAALGIGAISATVAVWVATLGGIAAPRIDAPGPERLARVQGAPTVWVAGDSVALSVVSRWYADPARYHLNPVDHARIGCSVAATGHRVRSFAGPEVRPAPCQPYALAGIERVRPDIVYLLVGSRPNDAYEIDGRFVRACDPAYDANYREATVALLRRFRAVGAEVVVGTVLRSGATSLPVAGSEERIDCVNRVIDSLPGLVPGVHVVDANELLCPAGRPCLEELGGAPVRSDGLHLDQGPGGDQVADWIASRVIDADRERPQELAAAVPTRTLAWLDRVSERALGRSMDAAASRFWGTRLVAGAPRASFTRSLVHTSSWRRRRVADAYDRWLGRPPDEAALDRWERWLAGHTTSELDVALASTDEGRDHLGTSARDRAQHLATALGLPPAVDHFERQLADGLPWDEVVRQAYFSLPASERRMTDLAPRSPYTPSLDDQVAAFRASGDERTPLVRALATVA